MCMYLTLAVILEADLIGVNIDRECTDVNLVVRQYDASLSSLLDKHAEKNFSKLLTPC